MFEVPLNINEKDAFDRSNSFVKLSFPIALNKVQSEAELVLINEQNKVVEAHFSSLVKWQNNSLKWVEVSFFIDLDANKSIALKVVKSSEYSGIITDTLATGKLELFDELDHYTVKVNESNYCLSKHHLGLLQQSQNDKNDYKQAIDSFELADENNKLFSPSINSVKVTKHTSLELVINYQGIWKNKHKASAIEFNFSFSFYKNSSRVKHNFSIHNPLPMLHHKGKWDLGNENSFLFNSLVCKANTVHKSTVEYKLDGNKPWQNCATNSLSIFQASSGGKNWQSKNHIDSKGKLALEFSGYKVSDGDKSSIHQGRSSPIIKCSNAKQSAAYAIDDFWQNFPTSIACNQHNIEFGLFPKDHSYGYELQPGEKKSYTFQVDFNCQENNREFYLKPLLCNIDTQYLTSTNAIPYLITSEHQSSLHKLINSGIDSDNDFFVKREKIDEFGWRNFGDIFADHETLETNYATELISHYNNQYDPLYGFIYQFLKTKDQRWWTLAQDLAQHIKDIDIYHTEKDKAHYNNGLFWHTDHYLSAETATHRTYSALQKSNAYQDHAGGGGPGTNHCYTTGLMLHYLLTGDQSSKDAVLQLSQWITNVFEGTGTFGEMLVALKNNNRADLKNTLKQQYPLDRGTGNYVSTLIDSFELTSKQSYLDKAGLVIKQTISHFDDINKRDLLNVEESWFYTIFLQSVYKYLLIKESITQFDHCFYLIKKSFMHYCHWMLDNEYPYLDKPEILEYPNHTWTAQDIRKANILYMAFYFAEDKTSAQAYKAKADFFYQYVVHTLEHEPSRTVTRILAILMQNDGIKEFVKSNKCKAPKYNLMVQQTIKPSQTKQFLLNVLTAFEQTSIKKEFFWLRTLSTKLNCFLIKAGL
ncbi:hypothetical protein [Thalassomonas sp. M1454]|uniref:hypothetical protein n=1 Tax=Thalassomonas sp. M1454 TaxID=2594477 RepID=UPI00117D5637|nr:hypothetical protein [Thalassomonas sp. M1454]TRX57931.1 hypothetical protein FNN08_00660 [Thalassomonas sp. M1454]